MFPGEKISEILSGYLGGLSSEKIRECVGGISEDEGPFRGHSGVVGCVHVTGGILSVRYAERSAFEGQPLILVGGRLAFGVIGNEDALSFLRAFPETDVVIVEVYDSEEVGLAKALQDAVWSTCIKPCPESTVLALADDPEKCQLLLDHGLETHLRLLDLVSAIPSEGGGG